MTANAMASDREACLAAGMNDHVGKPFDLEHLVQVLRVQAGRPLGPGPETPLNPERPSLAQEIGAAAATAGVNIEAAIARLGGRTDVYRRMLQRFVDELPGMAAELSSHMASVDTQAAARLLHTVKGVAATLGAEALAAEASKHESTLSAQSGSAAALQAIFDAEQSLARASPGLSRLLEALQEFAQAPNPGLSALPLSESEWLSRRVSLQRLAGLLRNSDMAALDAVGLLRGHFGGALGERLQALDAAVNALDFDAALRHCEDLLAEGAR
jgi:HPt (histidine-containing phosphotransfer) domain-containing protein